MSDVLPGAASDRASKAPLGCVCLFERRSRIRFGDCCSLPKARMVSSEDFALMRMIMSQSVIVFLVL